MSKFNKARFVTGNDISGIRMDVGLQFHKTIDYDRKKMRRALNEGAKDVRKEARRLLSRKALASQLASQPGDAPFMQTGRLMRSIGTISRGNKGGWVKVGPRTIKGSVFYPAFLFYGAAKIGLAKRANYMEQALANKAAGIKTRTKSLLAEALVPR
jgi:hypothetical protein